MKNEIEGGWMKNMGYIFLKFWFFGSNTIPGSLWTFKHKCVPFSVKYLQNSLFTLDVMK